MRSILAGEHVSADGGIVFGDLTADRSAPDGEPKEAYKSPAVLNAAEPGKRPGKDASRCFKMLQDA